MTEKTYEVVVEETWTCYPAHLNDGDEPLPALSKPVETISIDIEELDRDEQAVVTTVLTEADIGGKKNPYLGFGEYVAELHDWLVENSEQKAEGFLQVANWVIKDDWILNESDEPYRWYWTYEPQERSLTWLYEMKKEFMPEIAELGDSIAGKISASADEGILERTDSPDFPNTTLNGVAL